MDTRASANVVGEGGAPPTPAATTPLTDTKLLQLSLRNAVASAAAGKATIAANNYALVIKIVFRKCFLLEELVLLALAMGYEARQSSATAAAAAAAAAAARHTETRLEPSNAAHPLQPPHDRPLSPAPPHADPNAELVDPLANVGMLLPPGLDEDDYDEERRYYEQKEQREQQQHSAGLAHAPARSSSSTAMRGGTGSGSSGVASPASPSSPTADDSTPGYDSATARWLACLLAKVHPDALPIATLEKICKVPLTATATAASTGANRFMASNPAAPASAPSSDVSPTATTGTWPCASPPVLTRATESTLSLTSTSGAGSPTTVSRLLPHLKASPASSPIMASPASRAGAAAAAAAAAATSAGPVSTASLPLLFATLLWDVACALWNQGFIEDAHHWLSVMDVRRLWRLYRDVCRHNSNLVTGTGGDAAGAGGRPTSTTSAAAAVSLFASGEPLEDPVDSAERACALSWPAVLAETRAADDPPPPPPRHTEEVPTALITDSQDDAAAPSARPALPRARSGITISAFAPHSEPLPMAGPSAAEACVEEATWRDESLAVFVRRLARRTSALRDLCALMIACETAEDVFYVMFALNGARVTQQVKYDQASPSATASLPPPSFPPARRAGSEGGAAGNNKDNSSGNHRGPTSPTTTTTTTGGLAELLIVANLLVEFFITKRAQRLIMEEDKLRSTSTSIKLQPQQQQQQRRRTDRAIRRACDEVVCTFTNGRCLTLYALESYGIPPPYDGESNTAAAQLLAPELPYVLVSNVLSSTLNYSSLYRLSKVFHGVMGCRGYDAAAAEYHHSHPRIGIHGEAEARTAGPETASVLTHPNRTRRATEEEKERRRAWTADAFASRLAPATSTSSMAGSRSPSHSQQQPPQQQPQQAPPASQGVVSELLGFVRDAATGWRHLGTFVHGSDPAGAADSTSSNSNAGAPQPYALHHQHDVRPSFGMGAAPTPLDAAAATPNHPFEGASRGSVAGAGGGYAEWLAAARMERQWMGNPAATSPASSSTPAYPPQTQSQQQQQRGWGTPAGQGRGCELRTRGVGACELLLPSTAHVPASSEDGSVAAAVAAAAASSVSAKSATTTAASLNSSVAGDDHEVAVSLLAEEAELTGLANSAAAAATSSGARRGVSPTGTVLHTAAVQLQSRSPSEAMSLRLLTLLYRYPQLHTLEVVAASHVDLVARELNKALHILQVAMRERFGDGWWLQWRARREGETQRYYARALADAQRGGNPLSTPQSSTSVPASPATATAAVTNTITTAARGDAVPPFMMGTPAVQPDPSLFLTGVTSRHPLGGKASLPHSANPAFTAAAAGAATATDEREPCDGVLPPSAPPPSATAHEDAVLSGFWNTRTLSIPTDEALRERRQAMMRESSTSSVQSPGTGATDAGHAAAAAAGNMSTISVTTMHGDGSGLHVDWDVSPAYTPEVSLDFSAFTTSSVETQESTRLLVEALQRRELADAEAESGGAGRGGGAAGASGSALAAGQSSADARSGGGDADVGGGGPGVSILSRACRRLLHNELPLLLQYCPWRVIYSTRMHGISLSTLFANCRREGERHSRSGYLANPVSLSSSAAAALSDAKPMLLVLELPASTTLHFAEDDAGVRDADERQERAAAASRALAAKKATTTHRSSISTSSDGAGGGGADAPSRDVNAGPTQHQQQAWRPHRMFIGAFLSDLLRLESRRYYGTQDCFVFQLLIPGSGEGNEAVPTSAAAARAAAPQLRVHRSSQRNTQYINCRTTSIVIGGGDGGGGSVYLDNTLLHGATSACATFSSPPLSAWATSALRDAASALATGGAGSGAGAVDGLSSRQDSLSVLNVEVIVMDA